MELKEAKDRFIHTWGTLATQWGINRTMSQIHALLLLSPKSLNADEIMDELQISRGNVNMNLRDLMSWGIIYKQLLPGERKEYFIAEKDIWKVARLIARERKKRELTPIVDTIEDIKKNLKDNTAEGKEFQKIINDISSVSSFTEMTLDQIVKSEESWLINTFLKVFK
ncbi:MAG: transcriptional regulator [Cytophagaceae bacterium]|nr:transcriptional regulator [Cytophagaceae bacterium]MBK9933834.1 transcriptional regulator [Cytophagaceae bacterium]MBL0302448.1 transcriptional regulator [Cytophagaceae bacterium]MBL0325275.1 transcriptional regulator [Cytophagaceae bacterium]